MHPDLQARFDALEARRVALTKRVQALNPEQQEKRPEGKEFSPIEVLQHMALAEKYDVEIMRAAPPSQLKGIRPKANFLYRHAVKKMENAKRIATMSAMTPKTMTTADDAGRTWQKVRAELKQILDQVEGPDAPVIRSLLGTLSAADLMRLFEAHMHYHEVRFPKV